MFPSAIGCKAPEGHAGIGRNTGRRLQLEQRGQTPGRWTHREKLQAQVTCTFSPQCTLFLHRRGCCIGRGALNCDIGLTSNPNPTMGMSASKPGLTQCRWYNQLSPNLKREPFDYQEDLFIIQVRLHALPMVLLRHTF